MPAEEGAEASEAAAARCGNEVRKKDVSHKSFI